MSGGMIVALAMVACLAAFAVAMVAAAIHWVQAVRNRLPGSPWWRAGLLGAARLTEQGRLHRHRCGRLLLMALILWCLASGFGALAICCTP